MFFKYILPILVISGIGFFIYTQQRSIANLNRDNSRLETNNRQLQHNLTSLKNRVELQASQLNVLNESFITSEEQAEISLSPFEDSDLNRLANEKPILIERVINRGTKNVFEQFENISR